MKAVAVAVLTLGFLDVLFHVEVITAPFLLVFWATSAATCIVARLVVQNLLTMARRSGLNQRHILFVGSDERAIGFAQRLAAAAELGYRIIGFVSHDPGQRAG